MTRLTSFSRLGYAATVLALCGACNPSALPHKDPNNAETPPPACVVGQDLSQLMPNARGQVLRLEVGDGSGTGFVVDTSAGRLVATALHVVLSLDEVTGTLTAEDGETHEVGKLRVVAVDPVNDIALLDSPMLDTLPAALELHAGTIAHGLHIAALGYPQVAGSSNTLTFEPGVVTAVERIVEDRKFVQTNTSFNHGNSGGPVLDSCTQVVGVVAAKAADSANAGLFVSASRIAELVERVQKSPTSPEQAVREVAASLEQALQYRKVDELRPLIAPSFLREEVAPAFHHAAKKALLVEEVVASVYDDENGKYTELPLSARERIMQRHLEGPPMLAWVLVQKLRDGKKNPYEAVEEFAAQLIQAELGEVSKIVVDRITPHGDKNEATALIQMRAPDATAFFEVELAKEWGRWRITGLEQRKVATP